MSSIPLTAAEAAKALTGFEVIAIEDRFRAPMDQLSGVKCSIGLVWAHRRRNEAGEGKKSTVTWADVEKMTMQDLEDYFEPEPDPVDVDAEGNGDAA